MVRRQLRNHLDGLSVLSNMHSQSYNLPESLRIPANIREEISPNISCWHFYFSKNTGRKTTALLSVTSKKWIGSRTLWDLRRSPTSPHFRNSSAASSRSTSIYSSNVPWNNSTPRMIQFPSQPSIHPGSPADIPVIITQSGPVSWENISWKLLSLSIPINNSLPDLWYPKTGSMNPNMLSFFWKNVTNP